MNLLCFFSTAIQPSLFPFLPPFPPLFLPPSFPLSLPPSLPPSLTPFLLFLYETSTMRANQRAKLKSFSSLLVIEWLH